MDNWINQPKDKMSNFLLRLKQQLFSSNAVSQLVTQIEGKYGLKFVNYPQNRALNFTDYYECLRISKVIAIIP